MDCDVFSYIHWAKDRWRDFEPFLLGRPLLLAFCGVGELRAGPIKKNWGERRRQQQEQFIAAYTVVPATTKVVDEYASLHAQLHNSLKGGGVNDMWTAACALALGLPVVTNNLSDYQKIQAVERRLDLVHPDLPSPSSAAP